MRKSLYQIIYDDLKEQIILGKFPVGSQLPTEKELSETYNVSRITSKRALSELENNHYIYREQGRGSFVQNQATGTQKKQGKILFAIPFAHDLSLGNFYGGILPFIQETDFELLMTPSEFLDTTTAAKIMEDFTALVYYAEKSDKHLDLLFSLYQAKFPVVILDQPIPDLGFPTITSDNFLGGCLATQHLITNNHTKIGYIFGSSPPPQTVRQRYLGYLDALTGHSLDFHTKFDDKKAHHEHAVDYIKEHNLTAVICENDIVAIELIKSLQKNGLQVPIDVSVIGFDNIQAASLVSPTLTTIAQDFNLLGEFAGRAIIQLIQEGYSKENRHQQISVRLIERESTTKENS